VPTSRAQYSGHFGGFQLRAGELEKIRSLPQAVAERLDWVARISDPAS
jgi:hypothetical protein